MSDTKRSALISTQLRQIAEQAKANPDQVFTTLIHRMDVDERDELLDIFLSRCIWTRIYFGWRPNVPDEGDNHLIELTVAGGARAIVTRNLRGLSRMELRFPTLRLLTPEDYLREIRP